MIEVNVERVKQVDRMIIIQLNMKKNSVWKMIIEDLGMCEK